jgi:hypothetical protein
MDIKVSLFIPCIHPKLEKNSGAEKISEHINNGGHGSIKYIYDDEGREHTKKNNHE